MVAAAGVMTLAFRVASAWHGALTAGLSVLGAAIVFEELRRTHASWRHHREMREFSEDMYEREEHIRAELSEAPRYAGLWNPADEPAAFRQIFNTDDPDSFEEGGRWDLDRLRPFFDKDSIVLDLGCGIGRARVLRRAGVLAPVGGRRVAKDAGLGGGETAGSHERQICPLS